MAADSPRRRRALADLVLYAQSIARHVQSAPLGDPRIVRLTPLERLAMQHIDRMPGTSLGELAEAVDLLPSNASTAVRGLERAGLVRRERDADDHRVIRLQPTPFARTNLGRLREAWAGLLSGADLTPEALETAVRVLAVLEHTLLEPRPEAPEH